MPLVRNRRGSRAVCQTPIPIATKLSTPALSRETSKHDESLPSSVMFPAGLVMAFDRTMGYTVLRRWCEGKGESVSSAS